MRHNTLLLSGIAATVLGLGGCSEPPRPTDAIVLETVERPVWQVSPPSDSQQFYIPRQALVVRGGIPGVYVLGPEQRARFRMVRAGKVADAQVEVVSGLLGGERLLIGDLNAIYDGTPVRVIASPGAQP
jgi:hypothetical protein